MKKIVLPTLLVLGGVFIGWYGLINVQLFLQIRQQEKIAQTQAQTIGNIEQSLNKAFGGKSANK